MSEADAWRLLPWDGAEGKPCYVAAPPAGPGGAVSRLADEIEAAQLAEAASLLMYAGDFIADTSPDDRPLYAALFAALRNAHRVAVSRGIRLARQESGD